MCMFSLHNLKDSASVLKVTLHFTPVSVYFHRLSNFLSWIGSIPGQKLVPLICLFGLTEEEKKMAKALVLCLC